jgi:hypothetical protein
MVIYSLLLDLYSKVHQGLTFTDPLRLIRRSLMLLAIFHLEPIRQHQIAKINRILDKFKVIFLSDLLFRCIYYTL